MDIPKGKILFFLSVLFLSSYQSPTGPEEIRKRYADALAAIIGLGIRLEATLQDPRYPEGKNFLVSPLSAAVSLAQLLLGAEGETRDNLFYLLSLPNTKEEDKNTVISYFHRNNNFSYVLPYAHLHLQLGALLKVLAKDSMEKSFSLSCSSAWFVNNDIELTQEFLQNLQIYQAEIFSMNYSTDSLGSQKFINKWTADHTNQLIKKILYSPLPPTTSAIFLNTVHFRGDWEYPFSQELNVQGYFHVSSKTQSQVTYMRGFIESALYVENKEGKFKILGLPYKNDEIMMYIILPMDDNEHKFNMKKFVKLLNGREFFNSLERAKKRQVMVTMPKFQITSTMSLLEPLEKFLAFKNKVKQQQPNVNLNLTDNAILDVVEKKVEEFVTFQTTETSEIKLTKAAKNKNLQLSNMLQEITISVNEKGTEAAAVSMSIIDYIGGNKNFKIDRPFTFFIRHELTLTALFWGTVVDPSQKF